MSTWSITPPTIDSIAVVWQPCAAPITSFSSASVYCQPLKLLRAFAFRRARKQWPLPSVWRLPPSSRTWVCSTGTLPHAAASRVGEASSFTRPIRLLQVSESCG